MNIEASNPTPSDYNVEGGVDVDVTVEHDGRTWSGGVTLVLRHTRQWSSWGARDNWCSPELLEAVDALAPELDIVWEIEAAARDAIDQDL